MTPIKDLQAVLKENMDDKDIKEKKKNKYIFKDCFLIPRHTQKWCSWSSSLLCLKTK